MADPTISARPSITPEYYGFTSQWNAGGGNLPIQYAIDNTKFPTNSEDDLETFSAVTDDNGYAKLDMATANIMVAEDYVTVAGTTSYNGVWKVKSKDVNDLTIDAPYVADESGTAIMYYRNYRIEVEVWAGINTDHPLTAQDPIALIGTIEQKPGSDNLTAVDIHKYIKRKLSSNNDITITGLPNDLNSWTDFYIKYREVYDVAGAEVQGSQTNDSSNFVGQAVNGALQFQNTYGGNYYEYVASPTQDIEAKWLTFFDRVYWTEGRYWDASLIHDDGDFTITFIQYDINDVLLSSIDLNYSGNGRGVYRIRLDGFTIEATTESFTLQISGETEILNGDIGDPCEYGSEIPNPPITPFPPPVPIPVIDTVIPLQDVILSPDGLTIMILGLSTIEEYTLSVANNIGSVWTSVTDFTALTGMSAIKFNLDGSKAFILSTTLSDSLYEYALPNAYSLVGATQTNRLILFSTLVPDQLVYGFDFNADGTAFYVLGQNTSKIYEVSLAVGFDTTSAAAAVTNVAMPSGLKYMQGIQFADAGLSVYTAIGLTAVTSEVRQYSLSIAYDITSTWTLIATTPAPPEWSTGLYLINSNLQAILSHRTSSTTGAVTDLTLL